VNEVDARPYVIASLRYNSTLHPLIGTTAPVWKTQRIIYPGACKHTKWPQLTDGGTGLSDFAKHQIVGLLISPFSTLHYLKQRMFLMKLIVATHEPLFHVSKFSSHFKLLRKMVWILRFAKNARTTQKTKSELAASELTGAANTCLT
jgi:hypothetical protein